MPLLAGFLLVYISRGTLVAQHLVVGMTALFGLYFYVGEITILQCSREGYSFIGGLSAAALETLLRSSRVAINETALRQLLEIFTVSIIYSRLEGWRAPRWICVIGALVFSQLIGLALLVLTRIGVIYDTIHEYPYAIEFFQRAIRQHLLKLKINMSFELSIPLQGLCLQK